MNWYDIFNAIEAGLWGVMAMVILCRVRAATTQQRAALTLASAAFVAFGETDVLEIGTEGLLPLWLWGCKIGCGAAILAARYMGLGWTRFRWADREVVFGACCLAGVGVAMLVQELVR